MKRVLKTVLMSGLVMTAGAPSIAASGERLSAAQPLVITDAMIFDATGRDAYKGTVIIRDGRIAAVGSDIAVPAGMKRIDAQGEALLPGFFDVHTHWSPAGKPGTLPQIASAYIRKGITTVNDFHQQPEAFAPKRAWLETLAAPHVNFVARMSTPGGHGADWADVHTTKWVASPLSARREVDALQPYKPDYIKAFTDGWRYGMSPEESSMNFETLDALTDEAHKNGERVLSHTVTVERGVLAARAGVDVIAHSLQDRAIDDASVQAIRQDGTFYAPTLAIYEPRELLEKPSGDLTEEDRQRLRKWEFAQNNLRKLYAAGVPVALGTDAGIGHAVHGESSLHEMELMVEAGLSPKAALLAGTANSAMALGLLDDRGTIEPGKRADIVLLAGRPWENISDIRKVERVFVDGRPVVAPGLPLPAANEAEYLPPLPAVDLVDDFERSDGRSTLDTLRLADMDGGVERSAVVTNLVPRKEGGQALLLTAHMSPDDDAEGGVLIPLSRGSVQPMEAGDHAGIRFELKGEGTYSLVVNTLHGQWVAQVEGKPEWTSVQVPFSALESARSGRFAPETWTGKDLTEIGVIAHRPAGASAWAEIDNVGFYR
ncbi:amidohydrolase [Altericroceibacterium spongiae]|uniref:Amidohydrolase n=1 Tax=Altericroceibacterium spongiae TaxID=2320269 RepID=A0A420ERL9_9SPHN|nr:amidohydrolase family protein [Altericroceibacterium spongiae]RKF23329.1 amidohydrolase [Altericroceibacterium spongiae]